MSWSLQCWQRARGDKRYPWVIAWARGRDTLAISCMAEGYAANNRPGCGRCDDGGRQQKQVRSAIGCFLLHLPLLVPGQGILPHTQPETKYLSPPAAGYPKDTIVCVGA